MATGIAIIGRRSLLYFKIRYFFANWQNHILKKLYIYLKGTHKYHTG